MQGATQSCVANPAVQVSDTTMPHSSNTAGNMQHQKHEVF